MNVPVPDETFRLLVMILTIACGEPAAGPAAPADGPGGAPSVLPQTTALWISVDPAALRRTLLERPGFDALDAIVPVDGRVPPKPDGDGLQPPAPRDYRAAVLAATRRDLRRRARELGLEDDFFIDLAGQIRRIHLTADEPSRPLEMRLMRPGPPAGRGRDPAPAPDAKTAKAEPGIFLWLEGVPSDAGHELIRALARAGGGAGVVEWPNSGGALAWSPAGAEGVWAAAPQGIFWASARQPVERLIAEAAKRLRQTNPAAGADAPFALPERAGTLSQRLNRFGLADFFRDDGDGDDDGAKTPPAVLGYLAEDYAERFGRHAEALVAKQGWPKDLGIFLKRLSAAETFLPVMEPERAGPVLLRAEGGSWRLRRMYHPRSQFPAVLRSDFGSKLRPLLDDPALSLGFVLAGDGERLWTYGASRRLAFRAALAAGFPGGDATAGLAAYEAWLRVAGTWLGLDVAEAAGALREAGALLAKMPEAPGASPSSSPPGWDENSALALRFGDNAAMRKVLGAVFARLGADGNSVADALARSGDADFSFLLRLPPGAPRALAGSGDVAVFGGSLDRVRGLAARLARDPAPDAPPAVLFEERFSFATATESWRGMLAEILAAYHADRLTASCEDRLSRWARALAENPPKPPAAAESDKSAKPAKGGGDDDEADPEAAARQARAAARTAARESALAIFSGTVGGAPRCPLAELTGQARDNDYGVVIVFPAPVREDGARRPASGPGGEADRKLSKPLVWCRRGHWARSADDPQGPCKVAGALADGRVVRASLADAAERARLNAALRVGGDADWVENRWPEADVADFAAAPPTPTRTDRTVLSAPAERLAAVEPVLGRLRRAFAGWGDDRWRLAADDAGVELRTNGQLAVAALSWTLGREGLSVWNAARRASADCATRLAALYPVLVEQDAKDGRIPRDWSELGVASWTAFSRGVDGGAQAVPDAYELLTAKLPRNLFHLSVDGVRTAVAAGQLPESFLGAYISFAVDAPKPEKGEDGKSGNDDESEGGNEDDEDDGEDRAVADAVSRLGALRSIPLVADRRAHDGEGFHVLFNNGEVKCLDAAELAATKKRADDAVARLLSIRF